MGMPNIVWKAHGKKLSVGTYDDALPGEQWPFAVVRRSETARDRWVVHLDWLHPNWASDAVNHAEVPELPESVAGAHFANTRGGARAVAITLFEKVRDDIGQWNRARRGESEKIAAEPEETLESVRNQRDALAAMLIDIVGPDVVAQYLRDEESDHDTSAN